MEPLAFPGVGANVPLDLAMLNVGALVPFPTDPSPPFSLDAVKLGVGVAPLPPAFPDFSEDALVDGANVDEPLPFALPLGESPVNGVETIIVGAAVGVGTLSEGTGVAPLPPAFPEDPLVEGEKVEDPFPLALPLEFSPRFPLGESPANGVETTSVGTPVGVGVVTLGVGTGVAPLPPAFPALPMRPPADGAEVEEPFPLALPLGESPGNGAEMMMVGAVVGTFVKMDGTGVPLFPPFPPFPLLPGAEGTGVLPLPLPALPLLDFPLVESAVKGLETMIVGASVETWTGVGVVLPPSPPFPPALSLSPPAGLGELEPLPFPALPFVSWSEEMRVGDPVGADFPPSLPFSDFSPSPLAFPLDAFPLEDPPANGLEPGIVTRVGASVGDRFGESDGVAHATPLGADDRAPLPLQSEVPGVLPLLLRDSVRPLPSGSAEGCDDPLPPAFPPLPPVPLPPALPPLPPFPAGTWSSVTTGSTTG